MEPIPPRVRRTVLFRQLLLQGCWNFEGMQNVGFAYCLLPALRHLYEGRPDDLRSAVKRHLEFFNTNPMLAGIIVGASVRIEERVAAGEVDPRTLGTFKVGLMGSLGAIGDAFFWGALKPMASVAGAILALVHPLLGIAALLALYNASHIRIRIAGFRAGNEGEAGAAAFLKRAGFTGRTEDRKMIAAVLGGAYAGVAGSRAAMGADVFAGVVLLAAAAAVHLFTLLFRRAVSPSEVLLLLAVIGAFLVLY